LLRHELAQMDTNEKYSEGDQFLIIEG